MYDTFLFLIKTNFWSSKSRLAYQKFATARDLHDIKRFAYQKFARNYGPFEFMCDFLQNCFAFSFFNRWPQKQLLNF
jgi:hypothetical protein